jgi:conjugal transfer pilus assembly protein TraL
MDKYYIPRYLDEPFKVVLLTLDEIIVLILPLLLGLFLFNTPIISLVIGALLVLFLKTIKGNEGYYFIYHLAYWYLPQIIKYRSTPPSYMREILG